MPFDNVLVFLVALKRFSEVNVSLHDDFLGVVSTISQLKHSNIIDFLGYFSQPGCHAIAYNYACNGSLENALFSKTGEVLSWKARINIAVGTDFALEYMHYTCSPPVAHGNVNAMNVLLGENNMPYLSDCGLTALRHLASTNSKVQSTSVGYSAPEISTTVADRMKGDVYSFGVLLLVLFTGKKSFDRQISIHVMENWMDSRIRGTMPCEAASKLASIILECTQENPDSRPTIREVAEKLVSLAEEEAHRRSNSSFPFLYEQQRQNLSN